LIRVPEGKIVVGNKDNWCLRLEYADELSVLQVVLLKPDGEPGGIVGEANIVKKYTHAAVLDAMVVPS
jgi:hypothetical protein